MLLSYSFEQYTLSNVPTDGLNPFVPESTSIWLGNDTAHIVVNVGYRFWRSLRGRPRPTLPACGVLRTPAQTRGPSARS
jgi:hypothetical protein